MTAWSPHCSLLARPPILFLVVGETGFENSTQKGAPVRPVAICCSFGFEGRFARESQFGSADNSICLLICLLIYWAARGASLGKNARHAGCQDPAISQTQVWTSDATRPGVGRSRQGKPQSGAEQCSTEGVRPVGEEVGWRPQLQGPRHPELWKWRPLELCHVALPL